LEEQKLKGSANLYTQQKLKQNKYKIKNSTLALLNATC